MKIKSYKPKPLLLRPSLLLLLLFAAAFALRALFPDTSYFFWDETVYLVHGKLLSGQDVGYSETFLRPPLLPLILSPVAYLSQQLLPSQQSAQFYELASRLLLAFLNSIVVFPVYYLTKLLFNKLNKLNKRTSATTTAFVAAVIVAVLPLHVLNSRWVMTDALGALLAFSSVAAYLAGFKTGKKLLLYAGGVLTGLAVLMKFTNLLLLVLLLPLLLVNVRKRLADVAVSVALFATVILPYLIFNAMSFGSPFYTFSRAFHVVAEESSVSAGFFLYLLKDAFGILLAFLAFGLVLSVFHLVSTSKSTRSQYLLYFLYCLTAALAYSFFVISKGVSKPAGIGWEAERFLLLFVLFATPFISYGITQSFTLLKNLRLAVAVSVVIAVVATAAIFSLYPQFVRAYTPAIVHEDGLREVTKEMGLFLGSTAFAEFGCLGNCPPVAYYSGKKMSVYYKTADLAAANHSDIVIFDSNREEFSGYAVVKELCSGSRCAYLLARR